MDCLIDVNKQYPVFWDEDSLYSEDGDFFIEGKVTLSNDLDVTLTMGITNCFFDPQVNPKSFLKFRVKKDSEGDYYIGFCPIEWGDEIQGDWFVERIDLTAMEGIYKVIIENEEDPEIENFHNEIERGDKPEVELVGQDGNAFYIIGACRKAYFKNREYFQEKKIEWETIQQEMMSGDYDNLLQTAMKYFDVN